MQANAQGGLASAAGRMFERVSVVRALAGRKFPASIAHAFAPSGAELVVIERYGAGLDEPALDAIERDARATMSLRHPNVATVRDVWREGGEVCVASEYVEGETLEELRRVGTGGKELAIEVGVRVVVDVLAALSAIHTHGAGGMSHGEVTATNAIVGFDGVTRLVRPFRGHVAGKIAEPDWFSYASPEMIRGGASDVRADLYAVGVLLWETLSRRKLFPKATREGRAARTMPVGKPSPPPDANWAAPLGAVAERALANDPAARYTTAAEMAAAVRLAVRSKLAMPPRVSAAVDKLAGERILQRRNANALPEPSDPGARISVRPSRPPLPQEATRALATMRASSRPPTPKPGAVVPAPVIPKTPALPTLDIPKAAGPRPAAPPLKLAEPPKAKPAPMPDVAPISVDDAFAEEEPPTKPITNAPAAAAAAVVTAPIATPEPKPAPLPVAPPVALPTPTTEVDAAVVPAGVPNKKSGRTAMIAAIALVALIAIGAVVRMALAPGSQTTTANTGHATATATATATAKSTATVTATTTTTATATATTTTAPTDSTTSEPEPSATGAPPPVDSSHRPHTRPRPTYDPMGI